MVALWVLRLRFVWFHNISEQLFLYPYCRHNLPQNSPRTQWRADSQTRGRVVDSSQGKLDCFVAALAVIGLWNVVVSAASHPIGPRAETKYSSRCVLIPGNAPARMTDSAYRGLRRHRRFVLNSEDIDPKYCEREKHCRDGTKKESERKHWIFCSF